MEDGGRPSEGGLQDQPSIRIHLLSYVGRRGCKIFPVTKSDSKALCYRKGILTVFITGALPFPEVKEDDPIPPPNHRKDSKRNVCK